MEFDNINKWYNILRKLTANINEEKHNKHKITYNYILKKFND